MKTDKDRRIQELEHERAFYLRELDAALWRLRQVDEKATLYLEAVRDRMLLPEAREEIGRELEQTLRQMRPRKGTDGSLEIPVPDPLPDDLAAPDSPRLAAEAPTARHGRGVLRDLEEKGAATDTERALRTLDRVKTLRPGTSAGDFAPEARTRQRWGVRGVITKISNAHGLCYEVTYDEGGGSGWFNADEIRLESQR